MNRQRLILHIGLMKSGTTSIQRALSSQRPFLLPQGVTYPDLGQDSHILSFVGPLVADQLAFQRFPSGLRRHVLETRSTWTGMFEKLADSVAAAEQGKVTVSAENLIYAGPATVELLAERFKDYEVTVVVTHRRASRSLISNYQQQARITPMPDVDTWARSQMMGLARADERISLASLRLETLDAQWRALTADVRFIDTNGDPEVSLLRMWAELTGVRPPERLDASVSNASLPPGFLTGVQLFQAKYPEHSVARIRRAISLALPRYRAGADDELPPRDLVTEVGDLLDRAVEERTHSRWIELERRLVDTAPVVNTRSDAETRAEHALAALAQAELERADRREAPRRFARRVRSFRSR